MEIAQLIGFAALGLALGALAWGLWVLFYLQREEKRFFFSWGEPWEREKLPKLPKDPLERAFKIGELLRPLRREATVAGFDKKGKEVEITFQTTSWGIKMTAPTGVVKLMYREADRFVEGMKLLMEREKESVEVSQPFIENPFKFKDEGPLTFEDGSPFGGLVFEQGSFRAHLHFGFFQFKDFLEDYPKVRWLLKELEEIKDVAEELVGALKAMEALGVG